MRFKKIRNVFLCSCFLIGGFLFLLANNLLAKDLPTTVSIINPLGPTAVIAAIPEKRTTNVSQQRVFNRSSRLQFKVYSRGANPTVVSPLFNQAVFSDDAGKNFDLVLVGLSYGYYDISVKGYSHLTRVLENVYVGSHVNLDFTSSGQVPLFSGDINLTNGDNKINALDVSVLMNYWGTGHNRADLNQDLLVENSDLLDLLANFNQMGD